MQAGVRGFTSVDQVSFFSDKEKKLIEGKKWPLEYEEEVDVSKVNLDVVSIWIQKRLTELLGGIEDDIVVDYCKQQLNPIQDASDTSTSKKICPKKLQINLTGFLAKNAAIFVKELWSLLLSAQNTPTGIPQQLIDDKTVQLLEKQEEVRQVKEALDKVRSVCSLDEAGDHHDGDVDNKNDDSFLKVNKDDESKRSVSPAFKNRSRSVSASNDRRTPRTSRWKNASPSRRRGSHSRESKDKRSSSGIRSSYSCRRRSRSPFYASPPTYKYRDQQRNSYISNRVNRRPFRPSKDRSRSGSSYYCRNNPRFYRDYAKVSRRPSPRNTRCRSDSSSIEKSPIKKCPDRSSSSSSSSSSSTERRREPSSSASSDVSHCVADRNNRRRCSERIWSSNLRESSTGKLDVNTSTQNDDKRVNQMESSDFADKSNQRRSNEDKQSFSSLKIKADIASKSPTTTTGTTVKGTPSKLDITKISSRLNKTSLSPSDTNVFQHSEQEQPHCNLLQKSPSCSKSFVSTSKDSSRSPLRHRVNRHSRSISKSLRRSKPHPSATATATAAVVSSRSTSRAAEEASSSHSRGGLSRSLSRSISSSSSRSSSSESVHRCSKDISRIPPCRTRVPQRPKLSSSSPSIDRGLHHHLSNHLHCSSANNLQRSDSPSPSSRGLSRNPRNRILSHHFKYCRSKSPPSRNRMLPASRPDISNQSRSPQSDIENFPHAKSSSLNYSPYEDAERHSCRISSRERPPTTQLATNYSRSPFRCRFPGQSNDPPKTPCRVSLRNRNHSRSPPIHNVTSAAAVSRNHVSSKGNYQQRVDSNSKEAIRGYNRRGSDSPLITHSRKNQPQAFRNGGHYEERQTIQTIRRGSVERSEWREGGRMVESFSGRRDLGVFENEKERDRSDGCRGGGGIINDEYSMRRHPSRNSISLSISPPIQRGAQKARQQQQDKQQYERQRHPSNDGSGLEIKGESHYLTRCDTKDEGLIQSSVDARPKERNSERLRQQQQHGGRLVERSSLERKPRQQQHQSQPLKNDMKSLLLSPIEMSKYSSASSDSAVKPEREGAEFDRYAGRCYMDHVDETQQQSRSIVGMRPKQQKPGGEILPKRRNSSPLQMLNRNCEAPQQDHQYQRENNSYKKAKLHLSTEINFESPSETVAAAVAVSDKELQLKMKAREVLRRKAN